MAQQIIIDTATGIAKLVELRELGEAPLDALAPHLITRQATIMPVLPDHTRVAYYNPETRQGAVIVEKHPTVETIVVGYDTGYRDLADEDRERVERGGERRAEFRIPLPYIEFEFQFALIDGTGRDNTTFDDHLVQFRIDKTHAYMRPNPIRALDDPLWWARIPNISPGGSICWGQTRADTGSLSARIDEKVKTFFRTPFNNHLGMPIPSKYTSYSAWERDADTIGAYLDWPEWNTSEYTVTAVLGTTAPQDTTALVETGTAWNLPEPPRMFTIGRAREWANSLDTRARRVVLEAVTEVLAETPA